MNSARSYDRKAEREPDCRDRISVQLPDLLTQLQLGFRNDSTDGQHLQSTANCLRSV